MTTAFTTKTNKIKQLANSGEVFFRDTDLAVLWNITNKNTLYTTIKRYVRTGALERVKHGIYSLKGFDAAHSDALGVKVIHSYCYISAETVLEREGLLKPKVHRTTFVGASSKKFSVRDCSFAVRKMKDEFLYNTIGIYRKGGVNYASVPRAVADILYFNPRYYFDAGSQNGIDWKEVAKIQGMVGYVAPARKT